MIINRFGTSKIIEKIGSENVIIIAISFLLGFTQLRQLLGIIMDAATGSSNLIATGLLVISGLCIALVILPIILKTINRSDWIILGIALIVTAISYVFSTNRMVFYVPFKTIIARCIPIYLLFRAIENPRTFIVKTRAIAYMLLVFEVLSVTAWKSNWSKSYSMSLGYETLTTFTILLVNLLLKWRWTDLMAGSISLTVIYYAGTRGPLFLALGIVVLYLLYSLANRKYSSVFHLSTFAAVSFAVFLSATLLVGHISPEENGINPGDSRIAVLASQDSVFTSKGRVKIYESAWDYAANNLFIGSGIVNDRIYISENVYKDDANTERVAGRYPHNIILEVLMQFGMLPGTVLLGAYIFFTVVTYRRVGHSDNQTVFLALLFLAIAPLMVSGSYLQSPMFYAFNGYMLSQYQADSHSKKHKAHVINSDNENVRPSR